MRDTVDNLIQPLLGEFTDNITLTARTARRSKDNEQTENAYLTSMAPVDIATNNEIPHSDTSIFKRIRAQIQWKQKTEIKTFPCDLEFAIQQNGQDKKVIKFIPPEIIPNQTDYFFTQNWEAYDGRPDLQKKLRDQLTQTLWDDYYKHQAFLNLLDTIPAENPGWSLPAHDQTQLIKSEFEPNPFFGQFGPN